MYVVIPYQPLQEILRGAGYIGLIPDCEEVEIAQ